MYNIYEGIDFRLHPELYEIGKGEQGVLTAQPYKDEILPLWRFKTPIIAKESANAIWNLFEEYGRQGDFVGMDMARKYLQMGYTRSRRYANHRTGQKYKGKVPLEFYGQSGSHGRPVLPLDPDPVKAQSAAIFHVYWQNAIHDPRYLKLKDEWLGQKHTI